MAHPEKTEHIEIDETVDNPNEGLSGFAYVLATLGKRSVRNLVNRTGYRVHTGVPPSYAAQTSGEIRSESAHQKRIHVRGAESGKTS